jgi:hypothetical protein
LPVFFQRTTALGGCASDWKHHRHFFLFSQEINFQKVSKIFFVGTEIVSIPLSHKWT